MKTNKENSAKESKDADKIKTGADKKAEKRKLGADTKNEKFKSEKENNPEVDEKQDLPEKNRPKKPHKKRQKGLYKRIGDQLEFYFSDANLRRDGYLTKLIEKEPWVPLSEFEKFNKIQTMVKELISERTLEEHLVKALQVKKSTLLELSEDLSKVKRVTSLSTKENIEECTIYVENIPPTSNHDTLKELFKPYGNVVYVSIPKFRVSQKPKGFAFFEFDNEASVAAVMKACGGSLDADASSKVNNKELVSITSFKQETKQKEGDKKQENGGTDLPPSPKRLKLDEEGGEDQKSEQSVESEVDIEMGSLHGLRILTKQQWRRLRNQYLNSQRKNISMAKRQLRLAAGSQQQQHQRPSAASNNSSQQQHQQLPTNSSNSFNQQVTVQQSPAIKQPESVKFESGLIVKVSVPEQIGSLKEIKQKVRELEPNVSYIDVKIGQNDLFVRCKNQEDSDKLSKKQVGDWKMSKLEGDDESEYWKVIAKDMADKKSGKVTVPKKKKKTSLIQKLEHHNNSHVFFPE